MQAFVKSYNTVVESIQKQLTTKPLQNPQSAAESATGMLFGDGELSSLLTRMRQTMYQPIAGLPAEMASPLNIGLGTGGGSGGQSSVQGLIKLDSTKLANAIKANPEGVEKMLQQWSKGLEHTVNAVVEPGGTLDSRISGEGNQISELKVRIATMNEMLAVRQKALQRTYSQLEGVISRNSAQVTWLAGQSEQLTKSGL